jgi:hypothetical protein
MFCEIGKNGRKKKDSLVLVLASFEDAVPALRATANPSGRRNGRNLTREVEIPTHFLRLRLFLG